MARLNAAAVSYYVLQRGDKTGGLVLLKLNGLEGVCKLLTQQRNLDGELDWVDALGQETVSEQEADDYITRARARDPDLWVIEIEDRSMTNPFEE